MKRFANAFAGEWMLLGGSLAAELPARSRRRTASARCAASSREPAPTRALIALDGPVPRSPRPSCRASPAYASSLVNQRAGPSAARDLEGVRFVDVPLDRDARDRGVRAAAAARLRERRARPPLRARPRRVPRRRGVRRGAARAARRSTARPAASSCRTRRQFAREGRSRRSAAARSCRSTVPADARHGDGRSRGSDRRGPPRVAQGLSIVARNVRIAPRRDRPRRARRRHARVRRGAAAPLGRFGGAAASITAAKRTRLIAAAREYLAHAAAHAAVPLRRRAARRPRPVAHRVAARRRSTRRARAADRIARHGPRRAHPRPLRGQRRAQARRGRARWRR